LIRKKLMMQLHEHAKFKITPNNLYIKYLFYFHVRMNKIWYCVVTVAVETLSESDTHG
jgi:hypothetical protein